MTMYSRIVGEGRPLVLLHGLFGSGDNWLTLAGKMKGLQVHLPDLRNHGQSFWSEDFRLEDLAMDVLNYLESQKLGTCVLAGHSLGAKVVMQTALDHPDCAQAIVCFDMAPRAYEPQHLGVLEAIRKLDLSRPTSRSEARELLALDVTDSTTLSFLLKNLVPDEDSPGRNRWRLNHNALAANYSEIWKGMAEGRSYSGPALFLVGADSDYFQPRDLDQTLDFFPLAQFTAIPGAGHWLHADQPAMVLGHLRQWLTATLDWELPEWI